MEGQRYTGVVKAFRGSFGWLKCPDVSDKYSGRDVFLHKNVINAVPKIGTRVAFKLGIDEKGAPKAEEATVVTTGVAEGVANGGAEGNASAAAAAPPRAAGAAGAPQIKRAALMISRGDQVLVAREMKDDKLLWSDLGGKVEEGESLLECALREMAEEAAGFISPASLSLLQLGLRQRYGGDNCGPEVVTLRSGGSRPQAVAVFPMDCDGIDLELTSPAGPNTWGVHEVCWRSRRDPELRDRHQARWPLVRALCALGAKARRQASAGRPRSRSRSPRGGGAASEEDDAPGEESHLEDGAESAADEA